MICGLYTCTWRSYSQQYGDSPRLYRHGKTSSAFPWLITCRNSVCCAISMKGISGESRPSGETLSTIAFPLRVMASLASLSAGSNVAVVTERVGRQVKPRVNGYIIVQYRYKCATRLGVSSDPAEAHEATSIMRRAWPSTKEAGSATNSAVTIPSS